MTEPTLKIGPSGYKLNPKKLKEAPQSVLPYILGCFYFTEDYEYFDVIKPYLDIPEPPKTLDEISQELDEKFEELWVKTKRKFDVYQQSSEYRFKQFCDYQDSSFEYARKNGFFSPKFGIRVGALDGSYLVSDGSGGNVVSWSTEFNLKSNSVGYYSIDRDIRFNMTKKPNFIVRFCMDKLLGFKWENK
jgi:hypothetical protein